jgi:thermolabile hemolysin
VLKKTFFAVILAILSFMVALILSAQTSQAAANELYVFGDSLSDMGTVFRSTGGQYPPRSTYFQGRYSNGKVWVEYLAERLKLPPERVTNFAWGGATTGSDRNSLVPGLLARVQSWTSGQKQANPRALYLLWAGANDYLQGLDNANIPVANVVRAIESLAAVNAKNILVANLPDLGQLPATRTSANSARLTALTQAHDRGLRQAVKVLNQQHSDLKIATLDAYALYRSALANPAKYGLTNVTSACLSAGGVCGSPDRFLFWDGIHPTTAAHRILGEAAFASLQESGMINAVISY